MSSATLSIRAHFDGKVIVPDEPIDLPLNSPLRVEVKTSAATNTQDPSAIAKRLAALDSLVKSSKPSRGIPAEALGRDQLYGDDER